VLENIIESIVITNLDGYLVLFNRYSEEMFGYRAEEVLNRHIVKLGAKEPDVLGHIRRNISYHGEVTLKAKDGRSFPAHVRCVPLRDEAESQTRHKGKLGVEQWSAESVVRFQGFHYSC